VISKECPLRQNYRNPSITPTMKFFDLLSFQHTVLLIFGGIAVALMVILAYYSDLLVLPKRKDPTEIGHEFPGGFVEGYSPVPLVIVLLIVGIVIWGFFYVAITSIKGIPI